MLRIDATEVACTDIQTQHPKIESGRRILQCCPHGKQDNTDIQTQYPKIESGRWILQCCPHGKQDNSHYLMSLLYTVGVSNKSEHLLVGLTRYSFKGKGHSLFRFFSARYRYFF